MSTLVQLKFAAMMLHYREVKVLVGSTSMIWPKVSAGCRHGHAGSR